MPRLISRLSHVVFVLSAVPATVRASLRLVRHREQPLDSLADTMRQVRPFRVRWLRNPRYLAATTRRLERWLPPWGYGRCFRRSMVLLDLWSRCGLSPRLHLGTQSDRRNRTFHAWVTTENPDLWTSPQGHAEIWKG